MKPPRRKNQYRNTPGTKRKPTTRRGNRIKTGPGILDRVKSAFNKKVKTSPVASSINTKVKTPPVASSINKKVSSTTTTSSATTTPTSSAKNNRLVDEFGDTKPSGTTILDSIAEGSATFSNIKGGYNPIGSGGDHSFTADAGGGNFTRLTDASGKVAGSFNQFTGMTTQRDSSAFKVASDFQENFTKDFLGNNQSTYSGVLSKLADKAGMAPHTQEYREYMNKARGDINRLENARKIYDRNYNFADHLGTVGPGGNIPQGFEYGTGSTIGGVSNDLQSLDIAGGGLGTPYTRINTQNISRMGRYVGDTWESQDAGSTENLENNPYQQHYWKNPAKRGTTIGGMPIKGLTYKQLGEFKPGEKDALDRTIEANQKTQFYNAPLHRQFRSDYSNLTYDYDAPSAPWTMINESGEAATNIAFHTDKLKINADKKKVD